MMDRYSKSLARDVKILMYGWLSGEAPEVPIVDTTVKNTSFHPYSLFNYVENAELCEQGKAFL